jgi:hypothetical protein
MFAAKLVAGIVMSAIGGTGMVARRVLEGQVVSDDAKITAEIMAMGQQILDILAETRVVTREIIEIMDRIIINLEGVGQDLAHRQNVQSATPNSSRPVSECNHALNGRVGASNGIVDSVGGWNLLRAWPRGADGVCLTWTRLLMAEGTLRGDHRLRRGLPLRRFRHATGAQDQPLPRRYTPARAGVAYCGRLFEKRDHQGHEHLSSIRSPTPQRSPSAASSVAGRPIGMGRTNGTS